MPIFRLRIQSNVVQLLVFLGHTVCEGTFPTLKAQACTLGFVNRDRIARGGGGESFITSFDEGDFVLTGVNR